MLMKTYNLKTLPLKSGVMYIAKNAILPDGRNYFYLNCLDGIFDIMADIKDEKCIIWSAQKLYKWKIIKVTYQDEEGRSFTKDEAIPEEIFALEMADSLLNKILLKGDII